ncbi:MAG: class II fructose-bisphosphate aldolase, partial [Erysipelotrichaceae bacterium]|nr:class II fructose-bisphosphate aldolase [Erysipelotrichaceae bacterium]
MMEHNLLLDAWKQGKAIGAFNANTYDDMEAIVQAASELKRPVILMASMSCCRFMGIDSFVAFAKHLESKYNTPVITHLDHCIDPELLYQCVDAGFDYVMFDGSNRSFEENCEMTAKIVKDCHEKGVFVEGELGVISGTEGPLKSDTGVFTDPDQMKEFIARTNLDTLAVSIGNQHGFYK